MFHLSKFRALLNLLGNGVAHTDNITIRTGDLQPVDQESIRNLDVSNEEIQVGGGATLSLGVAMPTTIAGYFAQDTVAGAQATDRYGRFLIPGVVLKFNCRADAAQTFTIVVTITGSKRPRVGLGNDVSQTYTLEYRGNERGGGEGSLLLLFTETINGRRRFAPCCYQNTVPGGTPSETGPSITVSCSSSDLVVREILLGPGLPEYDDLVEAIALDADFEDEDQGLEMYAAAVARARAPYAFQARPGVGPKFAKVSSLGLRGDSGRLAAILARSSAAPRASGRQSGGGRPPTSGRATRMARDNDDDDGDGRNLIASISRRLAAALTRDDRVRRDAAGSKTSMFRRRPQ